MPNLVLRQQLGDLAFTALTIEGDAVVDAQSLHAEVARAFELPEYYGANWDAFYDCFGDSQLPQRSAVLWRDAERLAGSDLKAFSEAVAVLHHTAEIVGRGGRQLELFLLGTGSSFRRPGDPVDHAWRQLQL
jgi:RNAse (barnase) inhibitor barstar